MTSGIRLSWALFLLAMAGGASAQTPAPGPAPSAMDAARCAVWARELGFAQSVRDHDARAFAAFLHEDAVFGVSGRATRGREAITTQWAGIIDGSAVELQWYPRLVSVGGDGRIAYSSGPALYRSRKDGSYRLGRFGSVWQRDDAGQWHVVFDDGVTPVPTDEAGVHEFEAGRQPNCPPSP